MKEQDVQAYRRLGALAQAARNYLGSGSAEDRAVLRRLSDAELPATVCANCVQDGLQSEPSGRVSHGICGPHADIMRVEIAKRRKR